MTLTLIAADGALRGAAVMSHFLGVGGHVLHTEPGIGILAVQSFAPAWAGRAGLGWLRQGSDAEEVADRLVLVDPSPRRGQYAVLDRDGRFAWRSGDGCVPHHEAARDGGVLAIGNMLTQKGVAAAAVAGYQRASGSFAERLLAGLCAAEDAGGDLRGKQAAALVVSGTDPRGPHWDARVDDAADPLTELARLVQLRSGTEQTAAALRAHRDGDDAWSRQLFDEAQRIAGPENLEPTVWALASAAAAGRNDQTERIQVGLRAPWTTYVRRLASAGLAPAWLEEDTMASKTGGMHDG